MNKIKILSTEAFRCMWNGKLQPVGSIDKETVKQYILTEINSGRATIEQFGVYSNYGHYNAVLFITL